MTCALATLAQNTQAGGNHAPEWIWSWQPAFNLGLAFLSLAFSVMAYRRAGKRDYRVPIRDFILARINDVKSAAENAKQLIEENISGTTGGTQSSHRNAAGALRNLETQVSLLEKAIPCRKDEIYRAWHTWQQVTTGGCYPVSKKANLLKPGDAHLANIHAAHSQFLAFLSDLQLGCLKDSIPFWKRIKANRN